MADSQTLLYTYAIKVIFWYWYNSRRYLFITARHIKLIILLLFDPCNREGLPKLVYQETIHFSLNIVPINNLISPTVSKLDLYWQVNRSHTSKLKWLFVISRGSWVISNWVIIDKFKKLLFKRKLKENLLHSRKFPMSHHVHKLSHLFQGKLWVKKKSQISTQ